ncbi:hypothetical protein AX15_003518 [Amanita polypyramis BW_CC]|nr:hypothetical protein AX15_003518 [Amanita polypyramis BW_CC]
MSIPPPIALPPLSLRPSMSSSPARSSSPPPLTPRQKHHAAYIHSSPAPAFNTRTVSDEYIFSTRYRQSYASGCISPTHKCEFSLLDSYMSKSPTVSRTRHISPDTGNDEVRYSFDNSSRSTFFMISAERGRWKTDPMPRKVHSQSRICKSQPRSSRSPSLSSFRLSSDATPSQEPPKFYDTQPEEIPSYENQLQTPVSDSADTLPSLASDRDSSIDLDALATPLSPLPPSSPPLSPPSTHLVPVLPSPVSSPLLLSSPLSSPISDELSLEEESVMASCGEDSIVRSDLTESVRGKPVLEPPAKPSVDVNVKVILGPRENTVDETRPGSRSIKGKAADGRKRKEDHPNPESTRKRRRIEGSFSRTSKKAVRHVVQPLPKKVKAKSPPGGTTDESQDSEIRGMLIESMALSRASSLPVSSLYKSVMQTQPALIAQKSEMEWVSIFRHVLEVGVVGGVFGKVESSGKDDNGQSLEPQWFYVPEMDEDQERAALIRSMMPRPGKRNETKKYKQYYYRPLDKISRWDPEDSL